MGVSEFIFDGVSIGGMQKGVAKIEKNPDYPVAERVVEYIHVDGRNGDYVRDTGAYANVPMTYSIYYNATKRYDGLPSSFQEASRELANWLNATRGYCRLEDSYDHDVFRLATMQKYTEYKNWRGKYGRVDVEFSCMPQRFLVAGEEEVEVTDFIDNLYMPCYPILIVVGNGTVEFNGCIIEVNNNDGQTMYIDLETQDAYSGAVDSQEMQLWVGPYNVAHGQTQTFTITTFPVALYDTIYLTYTAKVATVGSRVNKLHAIDPRSNFSYTYTDGGALSNESYTVTKNAGSNQIVFTSGSGLTQNNTFTNVRVSTVANRNADVVFSGAPPVVPTGGTSVSHTFSSLTAIPRWWVL